MVSGRRLKSAAFSPVLRLAQTDTRTAIQFFANWLTSKLVHGNAYILKERDQRGIVTRPVYSGPNSRAAPRSGRWFHLLRAGGDNLTGLQDDRLVPVPAKEVIHDVMVPLGTTRCAGSHQLQRCGLAGNARKVSNSTQFDQVLPEWRGSPGGILTAPGHVNEAMALRLKAHWESS